jgi:hypothetical protein
MARTVDTIVQATGKWSLEVHYEFGLVDRDSTQREPMGHLLVDARILAREKTNSFARLCMPAFEGADPKYDLIDAKILPANQPIDSVW